MSELDAPRVPAIRWGIVGASDIADRVMAPAMRATPTARLVALASRSATRGAWFAARHGPLRTYSSAAALAADRGLDAVYVATEVDRHCEAVLAAAEAGKDVLVEKPIARSVVEARRMVEACAAAGVRLGTCYYQRYNARHRRILDALAEGELGRVTTVSVTFSGRSPANPAGWHHRAARAGGGVFIDQGSHCIDLVRWLLADEFDEVIAFTATLAGPIDVEDTAFAILRMASGALVSIAASWSATDPSEARTSRLEIGGTDGTLVSWPLHDKFSRGTLLLARAGGEKTIEVPAASTHAALLADFAAARAGGNPFPITGEDGLAAQRVVAAVYESARTRRAVRP